MKSRMDGRIARAGIVSMPAVLLALVLSALATPTSAADTSRCAADFKAESDRITREAERKAAVNPPGRDQDSQRQFMVPVHAALKAAADRAKECEGRERRATGPSAPAAVARRETDSNMRAEQEMDYLKRQREARKNPTVAERATCNARRITNQTANGAVRAWEVLLSRVQVGSIVTSNARAAVLEGGPAQLSHVLLGMSFLQGVELRHAGRRMELLQKHY